VADVPAAVVAAALAAPKVPQQVQRLDGLVNLYDLKQTQWM
jgi:hypothetical protein